MPPAPPAPKALVSSSPGRAEKLPAPGLARLLRGKSGSRSRGRGSISRASPIFASRSKSVGRSASMEVTEEGEPSSTKVTCIGQVRIRKKKSRSNGSKSRGVAAAPAKPIRCRCLETPLLCNIFPRKVNSGGARRSLWRRWAIGLRSGGKGSYRQRNSIGKEPDPDPDPDPDPANRQLESSTGEVESDREVGEDEDESEGKEEETRFFVSSAATTPPKNALLLMRCRSAPHNRSSALATARFSISSPLPATETPEAVEEEGPRSGNGSSRDGEDGEEEEEEEEEGKVEGSRPLVLTRCKSEPAKKAAKMVVPEASYCFWNNNCSSSRRRRRLALVQEEGGPPLLLH